jgi:hypothetical protein
LQSKGQDDIQIFGIALGKKCWLELGQHSLIEDAAFWQFGLPTVRNQECKIKNKFTKLVMYHPQ